MRTAITLGRPHGKKAFEVVTGPEVHISEQLAQFKKLQIAQSNEKYEAFELWDSGSGRSKAIKSIPTAKDLKARKDAQAKAEADRQAKAKAEAEKKPASK